MKNRTLLFVLAILLASQTSFAQNNIWKQIFIPPAFHDTKISAEKKIELAFIRALQKNDKTPQPKGQMRAYNFNNKAVLKIQFTGESYIPSNYDKKAAAACRALLVDNDGTVILNDSCRKALFFTKDKLAFIVDFTNIIPKYKIKVSNFPKNKLISKKNYLVAKLPLPANLKNKLPKIAEPVLVATSGKILASNTPYLIDFSLKELFSPQNAQKEKDSLIKALPKEFYAKAEGFY